MRNLKLYILFLLISASALAAAVCAYVYMYHDTLAHTEHAITARAAMVAEVAREQQSKDILALASSTAASRERIKSFFVPVDDAVTFIQAVESIGSASGATVSISSINASVSEGAQPGTIGSIVAHMTVTGSWTNVMKAIELFEVLPYRSSVDHITLTTSVAPGDRAQPSVRTWQAVFDVTAPTLQ